MAYCDCTTGKMASKALGLSTLGALWTLASSLTAPGQTSLLAVTPAPASSPNAAIPTPECDTSKSVTMRYSEQTGTLFLESATVGQRGGCLTVQELWEARGGGTDGARPPLYAVDPTSGEVSSNITGTWMLEGDLVIEDGITFKVWGSNYDGHADELRLKSDPAAEISEANFTNVRALGGSLDFRGTKVVGWDTVNNDYDRDETDGRSSISAISQSAISSQTCSNGATETKGQARMDIVESEMAYMGYDASERYGLTWKVRGFCTEEIFDELDVFGNIYDSELHHMHHGVFTYGHQQGDFRRNEVHSNSGYGFNLNDDSDSMAIHGNMMYDNSQYGIVVSTRCNDVSIQSNIMFGGPATASGILLADSSDFAVVNDNDFVGFGDAGMAMRTSSNAEISNNVFRGNKHGVSMSMGCHDNVVHHNTISNTSGYALYTFEGSSGGRPQDNIYDSNIINGGPQAIAFRKTDGSQLINNSFDNPGLVEYANSSGNIVRGNTGLESWIEFVHSGLVVNLVDPICFNETDEFALPYLC